jgi:hypothetical protein
MTPPAILRYRGNVFTELLRSNYMGIHRHTRPSIPLLLCVFVTAGRSLPSRCLAAEGGIHFTEALLSNDRKDTHTDTQSDLRVL